MRINNLKNQDELKRILGPVLYKTIVSIRDNSSSKLKRLPWSVNFLSTKPVFHLNDDETLKAYVVNLQTGQILGEHYAGSGLSTINHTEQLSQGDTCPENHVLVFVTSGYSGNGARYWILDLISPNIQKQVTVSL